MHGGTSKAIVFRESCLPRESTARDAIFLDAIGSPDPASASSTATVFRTARRLFEGNVCVRARAVSSAGVEPIISERRAAAAS